MVSGEEVCAHPGSQPRGHRNSRQEETLSNGRQSPLHPPVNPANASVLIQSPKVPGPSWGWKIKRILVLTGGQRSQQGRGTRLTTVTLEEKEANWERP